MNPSLGAIIAPKLRSTAAGARRDDARKGTVPFLAATAGDVGVPVGVVEEAVRAEWADAEFVEPDSETLELAAELVADHRV